MIQCINNFNFKDTNENFNHCHPNYAPILTVTSPQGVTAPTLRETDLENQTESFRFKLQSLSRGYANMTCFS